MTPTPTLTDAITAMEAKSTAYTNATNTVNTDQQAIAAEQQKLATLQGNLNTDTQTQAQAATDYNASLDAVIAAAQAAKVPVPGTGTAQASS